MGYYLVIAAILIQNVLIRSEPTEILNEQRTAGFALEYLEIKYPKKKIKEFIYIGIKRQRLYLVSDSTVIMSFPISTSKYGAGSEKNSEKTPLGLHKIESKIGEDAPLNGILLGKTYTGKQAEIITEAKSGNTDDVTTRALRLEGTEQNINKGGNKDSYERDIYIHGTPEEGLIGTPASHGCIRMKNKDVIELFDRVKTGTYVIILNN